MLPICRTSTTSKVFALLSVPLVTSYVHRSPGRHSGGDGTDRRRSIDVDGATTASGGRDWSAVTHAPLEAASSRSTPRTRDEDIMKKSSHMWGSRRNNAVAGRFPKSTIELTPDNNKDSADKRDEGADRKSPAREPTVDQEQRQQDESPRDVG